MCKPTRLGTENFACGNNSVNEVYVLSMCSPVYSERCRGEVAGSNKSWVCNFLSCLRPLVELSEPMSNLSAPPHWTSFVNWSTQCEHISWQHAEKATPEGPDEFVSYKSMRPFPKVMRYVSGVYVKEADRVELIKQKKEYKQRKKQAELLNLQKEQQRKENGAILLKAKMKYESAMAKNDTTKANVKTKIMMANPVPSVLLDVLESSFSSKEVVEASSSIEVPYFPLLFSDSEPDAPGMSDSDDFGAKEATIWTGTMGQFHHFFQHKTIQKLVKNELFRFESSDWSLLNELVPYVRPMFHEVSYDGMDKLLPGPTHLKLDGNVCHLMPHQRDIVPDHPKPGTIFIWLSQANSLTEGDRFLNHFDTKLKKKRPATTLNTPASQRVTYQRGCSTALLTAQAPIVTFPTHKPVDWRITEKKIKKRRAQTAANNIRVCQQQTALKKAYLEEKAKQRESTRGAKSSPSRSKHFSSENGDIFHLRNLLTRGSMVWSPSEEYAKHSDIFTPDILTPQSNVWPGRVHTPMPYPPEDRHNLVHTFEAEKNIEDSLEFREKINMVSRKSKRLSGSWMKPSTSPQANNEAIGTGRLPHDLNFRAKMLGKIDNVVGDEEVTLQADTSIRWRVTLINESMKRMYYPRAKVCHAPMSFTKSKTSPKRTPEKATLAPLMKIAKRSGTATNEKSADTLDPVDDAVQFLIKSKRKAREKFLKAHPSPLVLQSEWRRRDLGAIERAKKSHVSLYEEKKASVKAERERLKGMVVDHMKDVLGELKHEVSRKKKFQRLARIARERAKRMAFLAAMPKPPPKPPSEWVQYQDPWTKKKYMHHKFWGICVWGGTAQPAEGKLPGRLCRGKNGFYDGTSCIIKSRYHLLTSEDDSTKQYYHDVVNHFCYPVNPEDEEIEAATLLQTIFRMRKAAKQVNIIRMNRAIAPLQARTRGILQRRRDQEKQEKKRMVDSTYDLIVKKGGDRISNYASLWKNIDQVMEEKKPPPPPKKKKFGRNKGRNKN